MVRECGEICCTHLTQYGSMDWRCTCTQHIARDCGLELVFNERGVYAIIACNFKSSVADMICLVSRVSCVVCMYLYT